MDQILALFGDLDGQIVVVAAINFVAAVILLQALFGSGRQADRDMQRRLDRVQSRWNVNDDQSARIVALKRAQADPNGLAGAMGRLVPRRQSLGQRLERTGRAITAAHYIVATLLVGAAAAALIRAFAGFPWGLAAMVGSSVGLMVPHLVVSFLISQRRQAFLGSFPEAIDLIVRGIRSGLPVSESLNLVGREMPDPVGVEFRSVEQGVRLGRSMEESLIEVSRRIDLPEFKFFIITLSVQRETGGNLSETLENLSDIIRRRRQLKLKVRALSSEARASAMILGMLPFVLFVVISFIRPDYTAQLFNDPRGVMMVVAGLTSQAIGIAVMIKMIRFEI